MKRIAINTLIMLLLPLLCEAQSAQWLLAPKYKDAARLSSNLYRLKGDNGEEIFDVNSEKFLDVRADSITTFTEGWALALKKEKNRYKIEALIGQNGNVIKLADEVFAVEYSFFSEGKMSVKNKKNKFGYIGADSKIVIECQYGAAYPFKNGVAMVSKAAGLLSSALKSVGVGGKQDVFYIDEKGEVVDAPTDYIVTAKTDILPIIEADGPTVFAEKDRYGYMNDAYCVLPPQFLAAESFVAGYAIAATSTGKGLLKIIKEPFQCQLTKTEYKDGMENTEHTAVIPTEPKDAVLKMKCVDSTGMKFEDKGKKKGGNMLFALSTFRERRTFTVESTNSKGTLVLWSSVYNQSQDKETPVPTNKKTKAKKNKKSKRK